MVVYDPAVNSASKLNTVHNTAINDDAHLGSVNDEESILETIKADIDYELLNTLYSYILSIALTSEQSDQVTYSFTTKDKLDAEEISNIYDKVVDASFTAIKNSYDDINVKSFVNIVNLFNYAILKQLHSYIEDFELQTKQSDEVSFTQTTIEDFSVLNREAFSLSHLYSYFNELAFHDSMQSNEVSFTNTTIEDFSVLDREAVNVSHIYDMLIDVYYSVLLKKFDDINIVSITKANNVFGVLQKESIVFNIELLITAVNKKNTQSFTGIETAQVSYDEIVENEYIPINIKKSPVAGRRLVYNES